MLVPWSCKNNDIFFLDLGPIFNSHEGDVERPFAIGNDPEINGHRISDFPHIAKRRGSVEGFEQTPQANRWILEIQIRHKVFPYGAFYEDLLN